MVRNVHAKTKAIGKLTQAVIVAGTLTSVTTVSAGEEFQPWKGDLELGFVSTSGNTETTTIKTNGKLVEEGVKWRNSTIFSSLNTKEDDERSAEKYFLSNKVDYKFSEHGYIFGFVSYDDDRFSGFDWQATIAAGYGRTLLNNIDNMRLNLELGPGYRISKVDEDAVGEDDQEEAILRASADYEWQLSDSAVFAQALTVEGGSDNTISKSITSLKTTIVGQFALKLAYTIKYTETVPLDTDHADTETSVTLVYSF